MRVKLFTHNDFDGIGCGILATLAFEKVDIEYCTYSDINEKVSIFIEKNEFKNYDQVYITDMSVILELAERIEVISQNITLIDHHPTALHLKRFSWCRVSIENEKGKCCGTSLFYEHLKGILDKENITEFVETVRQYDTWEWLTIYNNEVPKKWNDLLYIYGIKRFTEKLITILNNANDFNFDKTDLLLLDIEEDKKKIYFKKKNKEMIEMNIKDYCVGIVFAEQYISELGNRLAEINGNLDFVILIGSGTISYRGVKDIDLGQFAKLFGGEGHPKASGSQIDKKIQIEYIRRLFTEQT